LPTSGGNAFDEFDGYRRQKGAALWMARAGAKSRRSDGTLGHAGRRNMTMRTRRETITFSHPFRLRGIDRELPAGSYDVVTDEEMIEGLSFPVFRRVATMITVPCAPPHQAAVEMIAIDPEAVRDARQSDSASASQP
jgi:hypothetical protein